MVTKEQCLLKRVIELIGYGRNPELTKYVLAGYNQGKNYLADCVFQNNDDGLDYALERYAPSQIINFVTGEDSEYNADDPLFVLDGGGLRSLDGYDFERMLRPEDAQKILNEDVLESLDDMDYYDAFEDFLRANYPDFYNKFDYDMLDGYNSYDFAKADWNELIKQLMSNPAQRVNENKKSVRLNESDLKSMADSIIKEVLKRKK